MYTYVLFHCKGGKVCANGKDQSLYPNFLDFFLRLPKNVLHYESVVDPRDQEREGGEIDSRGNEASA